MTRGRLALVALAALLIAIGGWTLLPTDAPATPTADGSSCPLSTLPAEAADTVDLIHADGPFPFPRNDGQVFGNREGHLPDQPRGYYHEYTVVTPGAHDRSTRRIITGGRPLTDPPQYFYTGDHYDSFCLLTGTGRRSSRRCARPRR